MPPYAKVFASILDSTIANHYHARHLFEDLLKLADWNGVVDMTPAAIARRTGFPGTLLELGDLLAILEAPDPFSRTPDEDGRRIVPLEDGRPWGWRIVNFDLYRDAKDADRVREQTRLRVQRYRARRASGAAGDNPAEPAPNAPPATEETPGNAPLRHRNGNGDRDREVNREQEPATGSAGGPRTSAEQVAMPEAGGEAPNLEDADLGRDWTFDRVWSRYPRKEKRDRAQAAFRAQIKTRADFAALERAIENYLPHAKAQAAKDPHLVMQGGTFFGGRWREWIEGNPVGEAPRRDGLDEESRRALHVGEAPSHFEVTEATIAAQDAEQARRDEAAEERERRRKKWEALRELVAKWKANGHGEIPDGDTWTLRHQAFMTYSGVTPAGWRKLEAEFGGGQE